MQQARATIEEAWVEVLARIYRSVPWRKVARGRNPLDIFEHRLRFASYEPTVGRVLDRLMNSLGLQAPGLLAQPEALRAIGRLREDEDESVRYLRSNVKLLVYLAYERARTARGGQEQGPG